MKLLTWNCQGAFRKKYLAVADLSPDLAVIQECEQPERIPWKQGKPPTNALWFGESRTKGVGIFSWSNYCLQPLEIYDTSIRYCIPLQVKSPFQFNLVAVWAMDHIKDTHSYSAQVYQAASIYRDFILSADSVVIGDFNTNRRTTPTSRLGNHATLTAALHDLWLVSAYHQFFFEPQGKEKRATFYRGRKPERPSHIDYAYIPSRWTRRLKSVTVGEPAAWLLLSDHCPLIVEIQEKEKDRIV